MDAVIVSGLRHAARQATPCVLRTSQRRWAWVHDVRFVATSQQTDKVLEKYKDRLDKKAKE